MIHSPPACDSKCTGSTTTNEMGKRKTASKKQPTITEHALPLLKKPMEQLGKQIDVPGNHWQGRMSNEERGTMYKCTVKCTVEYTVEYTVDMGGTSKGSRTR